MKVYRKKAHKTWLGDWALLQDIVSCWGDGDSWLLDRIRQ